MSKMNYTKEELKKIADELLYTMKHDIFCCADQGICNHDLDWLTQQYKKLREKEANTTQA